MHYSVGSTISDRYEILAFLGEGGFSSVYKAWDKNLSRDVALKVLKTGASQLSDEDFSRMKRESVLLARLQHENIVNVYSFELSEQGPPMLVMEYVQGKSLKQLINETGKGLSKELCKSIFTDICRGLSQAHQLGIVHRDLSSTNILVSESGKELCAKIIDFGLSKSVSSANLSQTSGAPLADDLTKTGMLVGNPLYMSPEACRGDQLSSQSDIYSLGCVLYEMLCGHTLFEAGEAMGLLYKQQNEYPLAPRPQWADKEQAQHFCEIALFCLQKDKLKRPASADELLGLLAGGLDEERLNLLSKWQDSKPAARFSTKKALSMAILLSLVAFAGTGLMVKMKRAEKPAPNETSRTDKRSKELRRMLKILQLKEARYGRENPKLLPTLLTVSQLYVSPKLGDEQAREALAIETRILKILEKDKQKFPSERNDCLQRMVMFASQLGESELLEKCILERIKFFESEKLVLGNPDYINCLIRLAEGYQKQAKNTVETESLLKKAIDYSDRLDKLPTHDGPWDSSLSIEQRAEIQIGSRVELAHFYESIGRFDEALRLLNEGKTKIKKVLAMHLPFSEATLGFVYQCKNCLYKLASFFSNSGEFSQAEKVLEDFSRILDMDGLKEKMQDFYQISRLELPVEQARVKRAHGKYIEAAELYNQNLDRVRQLNDPLQFVARAYEPATFYLESGLLHKAKSIIREAQAASEKAKCGYYIFGNMDFALARVKFCEADPKASAEILHGVMKKCAYKEKQIPPYLEEWLGHCYRKLCQFDKSQMYYKQAIAREKKSELVNADFVYSLHRALASVYELSNRRQLIESCYDESERVLRVAMEREKLAGNKKQASFYARRLAEVLCWAKKSEQAEKLLKLELAAMKSYDTRWKAKVLICYARCLREQKKFLEAEKAYKQSIDTLGWQKEPNRIELSEYISELAHLYFDFNKMDLADEYFQRALKIRNSELGIEFPIMDDRFRYYVKLLADRGLKAKSDKLRLRLSAVPNFMPE